MGYRSLALLLVGVLLAAFMVVEALDIELLTDAESALDRPAPSVALLGIALLIADVAIPVPSSVVMTANGALFGVVAGAGLSMAGALGAAMVGYALGRRGGRLVTRIVRPGDRVRADRLFARWGVAAVMLTRPVPLLAESTVILAGVSAIGARRVALASVCGCLPPAVLYAHAGQRADDRVSAAVVFGAVLAVTGTVMVIRLLVGRHDGAKADGPRERSGVARAEAVARGRGTGGRTPH